MAFVGFGGFNQVNQAFAPYQRVHTHLQSPYVNSFGGSQVPYQQGSITMTMLSQMMNAMRSLNGGFSSFLGGHQNGNGSQLSQQDLIRIRNKEEYYRNQGQQQAPPAYDNHIFDFDTSMSQEDLIRMRNKEEYYRNQGQQQAPPAYENHIFDFDTSMSQEDLIRMRNKEEYYRSQGQF